MARTDAIGRDRAASLDASWLAGRRWFRSKSRPLRDVTLHDAARLDSGGAWLLVLAARFVDGGEERYLVPAVADADGSFREPRDGEGAWRGIVMALFSGVEVAGQGGRFTFHATDALRDLLPGGAIDAAALEERRFNVEQSNTSVRLGDRLLLKIYRMLEPGTNPEVEVNAFLTQAGFDNAPALAGWIGHEPDGEGGATAGMVQALVPSRGDGWQWMLNQLGSPPQGPVEALAGTAMIGGITAEMHGALASRPEVPGFEVEAADEAQCRAWRASAERQLDGALASVTGEDRERLEAIAGRIRSRFSAFEKASAAVLTRIHGDYHLGQLLRTESSFMVIDFEGEPARRLAERREPASPLRDVAGMLRSFDYAARTVERAPASGFQPDPWLADARSAFLTAYGGVGRDEEPLLAAFEAEKACYEVRYEANNRPAWTWLPLTALERLAR